MKAEIVRALEEGTWAELRVRDWDLSGTAQPRAAGFVRWFATDRIGPQASLSPVPSGRGC